MKLRLLLLSFILVIPPIIVAESIPAPNEKISEEKTDQALSIARKNPLLLRDFLFRMPKGGDLHNHLVGAVYAETYIQNAADQNYCIEASSLAFVPPIQNNNSYSCEEGQIPAAKAIGYAPENNDLYNSLIDALSMRNFIAAERTGYEHFFACFDKFILIEQRYPEWLHEVGSRAAQQNEQYLELMTTPDCDSCFDLASTIKKKSATDLAKPESILLSWDFSDEIKTSQQFLRDIEQQRLSLAECSTNPQNPACKLEIHYIFQGLRALPKEIVFAQLAFAFRLVDAEAETKDPRMVGINLVMPEDQYYARQDYTEHMEIIGFLKSQYPRVNISLHAGELAPGLVTPEDLRFHINQAVNIGKAQRIGHGTSIIYEDNYEALIKQMATDNILVEINLSSADEILNVTGDEHPFKIYQKYGVPMAISTDDEGVLRSDMTQEYERAVSTYDLSYTELKILVRNSLEYSFLPGESLWQEHDYKKINTACKDVKFYPLKITDTCETWLKNNKKAYQQMELEHRFEDFENSIGK
jgi:adenosine deaminase